jgi:hypothetical protein
VGFVIAVLINGRSRCYIFLNKHRYLIPACLIGTTNGFSRGSELFVHAKYNGTWQSMSLFHVQIHLFMKGIHLQEYSTENLTETQKVMLVDLRDYGLVWQRKVCP